MPGLGVNTAIVRDNRILLTLRSDWEVWCLPGGGVEANESLAQAAIRETREELGFDVQLTRLVGLYSRNGWIDPRLACGSVFGGDHRRGVGAPARGGAGSALVCGR